MIKQYLSRLLVLLCVLAFVSADFDDVVVKITSVSPVPNDLSDVAKGISFEGGSYIYIRGSGFSTKSPLSNKVTVDGKDCPVIEFLTTPTQVVCEVPRSDYTATQRVNVKVFVDEIRVGTCDKCFLMYTPTKTPDLMYLIPNAGNPGDEVSYYGRQRVASSLDIDYIKIGDYRFDATEQNEYNAITFESNAYSRGPISVPNVEAGYYNVTQKNKYVGFARKLRTTSVYKLGQNSYDFAVVPKIDSITSNRGSSEGQIITITGSGFSSIGQNEVQLADTPCKILKQSTTQIECELQPRNTPIPEQGYHAGLKFELYKNIVDITQVIAGTAGAPSSKTAQLLPEVMAQSDSINFSSSKLSGYFKAPVTGDYRFAVSSDDIAALYISKTPQDKTNLQKIVDIPTGTGYKTFFSSPEFSQVSEKIPLVAGNYYYMELYHFERNGGDFATVGVYVPGVVNSVSNPPAVQSVKINCAAPPEVIEFRLDKATGGQWVIKFNIMTADLTRSDRSVRTAPMAFNVLPTVVSDEILAKMALRTSVTRKMLKTDGTETTDPQQAQSYVYLVTFLDTRTNGALPIIESSLTGTSVSVKVTKLTTSPSPIRGSFTLRYGGKSIQIFYNTPSWDFAYRLGSLGITDPVRVTQYGYNDGGLEWRVQFTGDSGSIVDQFTTTHALTGCTSPSAITVDVKTIQESSEDLFYELIPSDLLFTAEQKPQITVKSNGIVGSCPKFNCNYEIQSTGLPEITSSTYTGPTLSLSIAGVTAGTYTTQTIRVFLGNTECVVSTFTDSSSPAALTANCPAPEAGDYHPKVHFNGVGFAKVNSGVPKITISSTVLNVTPNQVNPNGGSVLTISGTGFSASLKTTQERPLEVKIGSANCALTSVTPTQIQCITAPIAAPASLTVTLNGKTGTSPNQLAILSNPPTITSVSPTSVNPVLQTDITIIGSNFESNTASTKILLSNTQTAQVTTECLPISSSANQIRCKLLGAPTGTYNLFVKTSVGYSNSQPFQVKTVVTSISPTSGSNAGGTILTIQGGAFSSDKQQTLVFIGGENLLCDVLSSTANQVQCKTRPKAASYGNNAQEVAVATRIVEESICENAGGCLFTYSDSLTPVVTSLNLTSVTLGGTLQIFGTGLESNPPGTPPVVTIDGQVCSVTSNSDTQITITVSPNIVPKAAAIVLNIAGKGDASFNPATANTVQVTPVLSSTSPTTGSTSGVLLTLVGAGFQNGAVVRVGTGLCEIRSLTSTNIVCKANTTGEVTYSYGSFNYIRCVGLCRLTLSATQIPTIASVSSSNPTASSLVLTIQGTQLNLGTAAVRIFSQTDKTIEFTGTVTSSSPTQILASFSNVAAGNYAVEVTSGASIASGSVSVVNVPLSVSVSSPVVSSIGGGNTLTIAGSGFFDNTQKEKNKVSVCGFPCKVTQSTSSSIQCQIPVFVNPAVKSTYNNIVAPSKLVGVTTWSDAGQEKNVFDTTFTTTYKSGLKNCQIGIDLGQGLLGELTEIKYFPDPVITSSTLKDTVIEGSNDNITYTLVTTIDQNAHDGWNVVSLTNENPPIRYRYYRLRGATTSTANCSLAELQYFGVLLSDTPTADLNSIECKAKITVNSQTQETTTTAVSYRQSKTSVLSSINPIRGTTLGGTPLTLTGSGFITTPSQIKVYIDDVECAVQTATTTQITCITGAAPSISNRRSSLNSEIKIQFQDQGNALVGNIKYFYIDLWSEQTTWGGITPPREGESVYIPAGQNVLLDISPPKLKAIVVEGSLIFDDAEINLNCEYILVRGGRLQIGTPENPIQNKITVTLYGTKETPQLPRFGNKVVALMEGIMDIHGKPRSHTWTVLEATADQGANSIIVQGAVDWAAGEEIVIASTDYDHYQSESRKIVSVNKNSPSVGLSTITFAEPLKFKHYAGVQTIDGEQFEMRAEVGLLTRNVVIQGDEMSEKLQYGVHIMAHSTSGDDSSIARISYTEVRQAGQAFQLGRYAIHYHLIGNVRESYVLGNSIHHSYNRAVTVHGVHFLKIQKNVAYWVKGHTIFIEDGIETHNVFEDNLVINTMASNSLLSTDQTPASFWITHPNNIFRRNRAAGSDRYGFWFDLRENPEGPSFTLSICPNSEKLGEFVYNQAHSNGRYGFRIFHKMTPRTYPCSYDYNPVTNPPIPAEFTNFLGWKNVRNAVMGEILGAVKFRNIKAVDNLRAGIEISNADFAPPYTLGVEDAWIVGASDNAGDGSRYEDTHTRGLAAPKHDFFYAKNIHFYNFYENMTAIETCSHCDKPASGTSGGGTTFYEGLKFTNVQQRVRFNVPHREILIDRDGSLTGNTVGGKGVVTYFNDHLNVPGCILNQAVYDGLVCDETVTIRKINLLGLVPDESFALKKLNILRVENNPQQLLGNIGYNAKHGKVWSTPFVAGYSYILNWESRADFKELQIAPAPVIEANDKPITLVFNYSEPREAFTIYQTTGGLKNISNTTTLWNPTTADGHDSGVWYHDMANKFLYIAINGKDKQDLYVRPGSGTANTSIPVSNLPTPSPVVQKETITRLWSNATQWPNQTVPQDGDDVVIPAEWVLKLDVSTSKLNFLHLKGDLYFDDTKDNLVLTAERIWVEGQLFIGTGDDHRYIKNAKIVLAGNRSSESLVIGPTQEVSNKVLGVTGNLTIYGQKVNNTYTRLQAPAKINDTSILVPADIDWKVGDEILLLPTQMSPDEHETCTIIAINNGNITLDKPLSFYHYGAPSVTKVTPYGTLDMRGEVGLLTRNIKIEGTDEDNWGGRVYVGEIIDTTNAWYYRGRVDLDGVEMKNLGQPETKYAGLTFANLTANVTSGSVVRRSVLRDSPGYQLMILGSNGIIIEQNILYKAVKYQVFIQDGNSNLKFRNNLVVASKGRKFTVEKGDKASDGVASVFAAVQLPESEISGNIIASCPQICLITLGGDCFKQSEGPYFVHDNVVHSGTLGWIASDPSTYCNGISHFVGYKLVMGVTSGGRSQYIKGSNFIISDSQIAMSLTSQEAPDIVFSTVKKSYVAAMSFIGNPDYSYSRSECTLRVGATIPINLAVRSLPPEQTYNTTSGDPLTSVVADVDSVWQGGFEMSDVIFENFADNLIPGCNKNFILKSNAAAADLSATTKVSRLTLNNVGTNRVYFEEPSDAWIKLNACGGWFCTGLTNIVVRDLDGSLVGQPASIMPKNSGVFDKETCVLSESENAMICKTKGWGLLSFESLDSDFMTRLLSPVYVTSDNGFINKINSYRDKGCDGWYYKNTRLQRFHSVVQSQRHYNVEYSGTPPNKMRWQLQGAQPQESITVQYTYTKPQSVKVMNKAGKVIQPIYVRTEGEKNITTSDSCGAHIYSLDTRTLKLKLTGESNCELIISLTNAIRASIRYEIPMDDFYKKDGPTTFIDRVAAVLNINPASIRIVDIRSGSTNITFEIESQHQENTTESKASADQELKEMVKTLQNSDLRILDSEILNASFEVSLVDYSPAPEVITSSNNTGGSMIIIIVSCVVGILAIAAGAYFAYMRYKSRKVLILNPNSLKISAKKVAPAPVPAPEIAEIPIKSYSRVGLMSRSESQLTASNGFSVVSNS